MMYYDLRHAQVIDLVQKHKDNKINEVRFVDCYAEPGKQREFQVIFGDGTQNTPELETLLKGLIAVLENRARLVLKNEPRYRAWREDEVPELAQYRNADNHESTWYYHRENVMQDGGGEMYLNNCQYRTDLSKDVWHPCGVEVSDE